MSIPNCYGIIPARYDSTRFPGKPLAQISGKPMFWHVFERAKQSKKFAMVVLATDDDRIESAAKDLGVPVVMTKSDHPSGTDRVFEAAELLDITEDSIVVNIQGDEPAIEPAMLGEVLSPFTSSEVFVSTLARKISQKEAENPNQVKVVFAENRQALYFSRSVIPYNRDDFGDVLFFGHIGLYAFRMKTLKRFVSLEPGRLEITEKLEQLRLLENSIPIHVVLTEYTAAGVDTPADIEKVTRIINRQNCEKNCEK